MNLVYFLGRFHVVVLHLPIGILAMAAFLEVMGRRPQFRNLQPAVNWVWIAGASSAALTAALGLMHAAEGGFDGASVADHRAAGLSLTLLAATICAARLKVRTVYARIWPYTAALTLGLLMITGHLGGNLIHGSTYLAEYAPAPLRRLAGLGLPPTVVRKKPLNVEEADLYADVVAPALQQRCSNCHNDSKHGGGLSMASYEALMKGGEQGAVIKPGDPLRSEIVRRIHLAPGDKDFMPKEGKTPLSAEQGQALEWWISLRAPESARVGTFMPPPAVQAALRAMLGLNAITATDSANASATLAVPTDAPLPQVAPADSTAVAMLERSGFVVRPLAQDSNLLVVDFVASRIVTDEDIRGLGRIALQLRELNLRGAQLTDTRMQFLAGADNLARLRLEDNPITDAGVSALTSLKQLTYLNLVGTHVTDAGVSRMSSLPRLKRVYAWGTAVSPSALVKYD